MRERRLAGQWLTAPGPRDAVAVARRILAVQAQDPRGARLAIRARSTGLSAADVERELGQERSLLITTLNRGTLHLVASEDYGWLHALTTPPLHTSAMRRLALDGVSGEQAERALAVLERALHQDGPQTRAQLRERLERDGLASAGQAMIHVMFLAACRGLVVRGPMIGRQHAYVLVRDWLGAILPVDRSRALAELARRYLVSHGPASERDLAYWSGLPLRDARAALAAIAGELCTHPEGLVDLRSRAAASGAREARGELPAPRLLGPFDPILHGWKSRGWVTGEHDATVVSGGVFRSFALVGGRAVALWRVERGAVAIEPFARVGRREMALLRADGARVSEFFAWTKERRPPA